MPRTVHETALINKALSEFSLFTKDMAAEIKRNSELNNKM